MIIKAWQAISGITLITAATVLVEIPRDTWATSATISLILGATALACMAMSCILASRWRIVEQMFGGLDQLYQTHKWLGIWALVFAAYHLVFKAKLDSWDIVPILELPRYWTRLARQLSIVALGLIILLALNRNIAYNRWRWLHKLSGPLFLIVILHWLSFKSPIILASPSGIWLAGLCTVGVIAAFYRLLLYPFFAPGGEYKVASVSHGNKAVHLELAPVKTGFPFQAGQFGFLAMKEAGLREPHPFTIANAPSDTGNLHFVIRALGDYTQKLKAQVKVGMSANVFAPHGRFERIAGAKREIWIGAGVGISPFISWLDDKAHGHFERASLVYCFDPSRAFPSLERMQQMADKAGVRLIPNPSGGEALATAIRESATEVDPHQVQVSFCGPQGLLKRVKELMKENGIPAKNLHYEFFEFR